MKEDFTIVVLISGRGSNMQALHQKANNYRIIGVISDHSDAKGLEYAQSHSIHSKAYDRKDFNSKQAQKDQIYLTVNQLNPDLVVLAGFMQIVREDFVHEWYGKLINIHPSLLPEFTGLDTHTRALTAKKSWHGCSVHYLDTGLDTGPIIAQARVPVLENDTEAILSARVLEKEHQIYPWSVNQIALGQITLNDRSVKISSAAIAEAKGLDFILP